MTVLVTAMIACVALALPPLIVVPLKRLGLTDVPNHRSSHTKETLRGGGLAVIVTSVLGWALAALVGLESWELGAVCLGIFSLGLVGFWEDVRGLSVLARLGAQYSLCAVSSAALLAALDLRIAFAVPLGAVGVFFINAANFMDGVNGISGFHGVLVGANAVVVGLLSEAPAVTVLGTIVAMAFLGFIPWNFPGARMFLGDVGSYALGAAAFLTGIWVWRLTDSLLLALSPFIIYAVDVAYTLLLRARRGERLTDAHREHVYQRVSQLTDSHVVATLSAVIPSASIVVLSWLVRYQGLGIVPFSILALVFVVGYVALGARARAILRRHNGLA